MATRILMAVLFALWAALATAQGSMYESKDKAGPVFSDESQPGAAPVNLPPLSVIGPPPQIQETAPVAASPALVYEQMAIVSPEADGTIHTNTGAFDIQLQVRPALQNARGDVIRVKLDGNLLLPGYTSTAIHVDDSDWSQAATSDSVEHRLQAAIVDPYGTVLIESAPVRFYAHRAAVGGKSVIHHSR